MNMSDFFEMREAAERILADKKDRKLHGRIYCAFLLLVIGVGFGAAKHAVAPPAVQPHIVSNPTFTFTMVATK